MANGVDYHELVWSDDLSLGVEEIDAQHKEWIDLVHRFQMAVIEGRSREEVYDTLAAAVVYTEKHFAHEAELMQKAGYPFIDDHMVQHDLARQQIHAFTTGTVPEEGICEYLAEFLPQWLMLHINSSDRKFARWLNGADQNPCAPADAPSGRVFADIPV